ncbi:MAG: GDSL-type esterase/lipase family protein [Lachnospiraceae bacterium]|nr:GDSL-type esterase/lipase family protein [Lachnospiraceae bacterium]
MGKKKKKRKNHQNNLLVLQLLIIVVVVLVVFEGRLIYTMFTHRAGSSVTATAGSSVTADSTAAADGTDTENAADPASDPEQASQDLQNAAALPSAQTQEGDSVSADALAGLALNLASKDNTLSAPEPETEAQAERISEEIDSDAVVPLCSDPVDDSFFSNSVFIGDSRMMGFRNSSGITQGTFLTSVGLSTDAMSEANIASSEGKISVYQGLSGEQYDKIYLMLGTNDLGYYPWDSFEDSFTNVVEQFHKLQPNAVIYVCSVIYVDESKIVTTYDNNDNVRKVNGYLLNVCEKLSYCYYLNLNEIFTNGYGSLLEDASSDGIHLYEKYCKQMLDYLKTHYISE